MSIIERGKAFVAAMRALANRSVWEWRRCPSCGDTQTCKHGTYTIQPWFLDGRRTIRVQRHRCFRCHRTYSEHSALLVRGSWYAREVHRFSVDHWLHAGSSLRRTAELVRSLLGRQERWLLWRPLDVPPPDANHCHLSHSSVHRWLDQVGNEARRTVPNQLEGIALSGQVGADGLWAKLRGGTKGVVLGLVDSVSGVILPPVVAAGEAESRNWARLFRRAKVAGMALEELRGVTSDGVVGLEHYLEHTLVWVSHQRCVFHLWRNLATVIARQVAQVGTDLAQEATNALRDGLRRELVSLVRAVINAADPKAAWFALADLAAHPHGDALARVLDEQVRLEAVVAYRDEYNRGLVRVAPEWVWRDFRLRLSRGRNHGSEKRLERASLVWAIYRNFTPAQWRCERKRCYRRAGKSPLAMTGVSPGAVSYLDALHV